MFGFECRTAKDLLPYEKEAVCELLHSHGLTYEGNPDATVIVEDSSENLAATASIEGNVIKMVASDPMYQEAGLAGIVVSAVIQYAREHGIFHLFLYTKPDMAEKFSYLGFSELAGTSSAVLMESGLPSSSDYIKSLDEYKSNEAPFGAIVMNCNPFTKGHRYLIEKAASQCSSLYVIAVEEDISDFPFKDRIALIREGICGLNNVKVIPSGGYAVSRATFPSYFLKDSGSDSVSSVQAELDVTLFANLFVPALKITERFVGTEPFCATTKIYNDKMKEILPKRGVTVTEIERISDKGAVPISASRVREAIKNGKKDILEELLPKTTLDYLASQKGIEVIKKIRSKI